MFESLTQRLSGTIERLRGRGRLSEENIREATREVRIALLEADVALPVVQALIERIKVRAVGQEVLKSLTPGQALIKVVRDELTAVMGSQASDLNLNVPAPAVILMAGLQGAGKTTTVGKLAKHLKERKKKKVMVVSADVYRPAAIAQLETLAKQVDVATNNTEEIEKLRANKPELLAQLRVIWESPLIASDPFVWRKDLDPAVKTKLANFVVNYAKSDEQEKAILKNIYNYGGFRASTNAQLIPTRQLELYKDRNKVENDAALDAGAKAKALAEIDAKLAQLQP